MTNKTNFSPDGNLFIKGGLTSESFLEVAGDSSFSGEANFSGNVVIDGSLTANGAITFNNTTVNTVETTNNADGYVINADSDANEAYLQINSDVSNIRLTYNTNSMTLGYAGITDDITLNSNNLIISGTANIADLDTVGNLTVGGEADITGNVNIAGEANIIGDVDIDGDVILAGNTINISPFITGDVNLRDAEFHGVANTAYAWEDSRNLTINLTGPDVTGTGNALIRGNSDVTLNISATTVTSDAVELGADTTGQYVQSVQGVGNSNILASAHSGDDAQDITIDLVDTGVTSGNASESYGNAIATSGFTVDNKGRLSQANATMIAIPSSQVTDFNTTVEAYTTGTAQTFTAEKTHEANLNLENNTLTFNYDSPETAVANANASVLTIDLEPIDLKVNVAGIANSISENKNVNFPLFKTTSYYSYGPGDFLENLNGNVAPDVTIGIGGYNLNYDDTSIVDLDVNRVVPIPQLRMGSGMAAEITVGRLPMLPSTNVSTTVFTRGVGFAEGNSIVETLPSAVGPNESDTLNNNQSVLKVLDNTSGQVIIAYRNIFEDGTGIESDWANNTVAVTDTVVMTDRDATLANDYTFTGNVDLSGANVTDANVAHLGGTETFTGNKTFDGTARFNNDVTITGDLLANANVDLTGAVVTASTQANTDSTTKVATTQYVTTAVTEAVANLVGDAPLALDTLGEIANALIDDSNIGNVLTASIAATNANAIFKQGNVAMTGDLDLGTNKIVSLANPTSSQDATTKDYVDTANSNMLSYVNTANTNMLTYTDDNKVDKTYHLEVNESMFLQVRLANGDLVDSNDAGLNNPAANKQEITFDASGSLENIYLRTDFDASNPFSVITVGEQNNAFWSSAVKHGDMHFTGVTTFMPGNAYANRFSVTAGSNQQGPGFVDFRGGIRHTKNSLAGAQQAFTSNVATIFGNTNNPVSNITSYSNFAIVNNGTLGLTLSLNTPANTTLDSYLGSEATVGGSLESLANASTSGNASQNWSNISIGVERDHIVNLGNSTLFMGNLANANVYTNVYDKATESDAANNSGDGTIFGTGSRPLERLTVDGAITFGPRHTPDDLLVNGTIFYDANTNKLKGIQGNSVVDIVQAGVSTLDLGTGGRALAAVSGDVTYFKQLATTDGNITGIDVNADTGSVGSTLINLGANVDFIRDQISTTGNISYNNTTGVITNNLTTTDITEGDNLYYTDSRFDTRLQTRNVGNLADVDTSGASNGQVLAWSSANSQWEPLTPPGDIEGVSAGTGLSGGGTSGTVTLNISNTGVTAATYGTASQTPTFTVNAQGQLTSASQQNISITASQVSDFSEALDDRVSNLITGGSNITVTYDDANNVFTIDAVDQGDVNSIIAGNGLTGGGSSGDVTVAIDYADTWKGNIIPDTNVAYDLGSATARWNDLYLSGNTIFLGAGNVHTDGTNLKFNGSNVFVSGTGGFDTGDLTEGTNLYFTPARVRSNISATTGSAGYNSSTGVFTIPSSTDHISEGTNLYYTTTRANTNFDTRLATKDTDDLAEGTNLYYTQARFNTAFSGKSTTDLSEGTNQYYTTARANAAILDYDGDISPANANITGTFIASGLTYPSSDGTVSQVLTTNGNGTLSFQSVSAIGLTSVTGGDGLTATNGIGTVDLDVGAGPGINVNADNVAVNVAYVRSQFSAGGDLSYSNGTFSFTERTNSEVRGLISATGNINYNSTTGVISESLTTTDITEGNNLYFTNARARSALSGGTGITYNSSTGAISLTDTGFISGVSASTGLTGGGTSGNVSLSLSHLGLESLSDPNDDRILFWDDSAGATGWLDAGTGISITGTNMSVNMSAFSTTNLSEGTNLYYTTARANSAIDARVTNSFVDALDVDADTVDNLHASSFLRSDAADTHSGTITPNADNSIDLGSSSNRYNEVYAVTFQGTATSAQYADLAENYLGDANYEVGTVVEFGGDAEVTASSRESSPAVAGVVSTDPAYLMNAGLEGDKIVTVALRGRVPCKVYGPVRKGDVLIASDKPGLAKAAPFRGYQTPAACIVGKAISDHRGMAEGVVEILV